MGIPNGFPVSFSSEYLDDFLSYCHSFVEKIENNFQCNPKTHGFRCDQMVLMGMESLIERYMEAGPSIVNESGESLIIGEKSAEPLIEFLKQFLEESWKISYIIGKEKSFAIEEVQERLVLIFIGNLIKINENIRLNARERYRSEIRG